MAVEIRNGYCSVCNDTRKVERDKASHLLHFFLTLVTLGLWLIVWFGLSVKIGGWRCSTCGSTKISKVK